MLHKLSGSPLFWIILLAVVAGIIYLLYLRRNKIKPPARKAPADTHVQKDSVAVLPVSAELNNIRTGVLRQLQNPLKQGSSAKITARVFARESITNKELVDVLVSPAKPAQVVKRFRQEARTVEEAARCWFKFPPRWKKCIKKTTKIVSVPYDVIIPAVAAVYKKVAQEVTSVVDHVYRPKAWFDYKISLTDLRLSAAGNTIAVGISLKVDLGAHYEQNVIPLSPVLKIKGELNGGLSGSADFKGSVTLKDNLELVVDIPADGIELQITEVKLPTAIEGLDFLNLTKPILKAVNATVLQLVSKVIRDKLQDKLRESQNKLTFGKYIQKLVAENSDPIKLPADFWLLLNPKKLSYSQFKGETVNGINTLSISVGIEAKPNLIFSEKQPPGKGPDSIEIVTEELKPGFYLYPAINLEYKTTGNAISKALRKFLDENDKTAKLPLATGDVTIYPSSDRLVVGVDLVFRKNNKRLVTFYLWGTPELDAANKKVGLKDFDFTTESKNFLINIADWILGDHIRDFIRDKTVFDYSKQYQMIAEKLAEIHTETKFGVFSAKFTEFNSDGIFTTKNWLTVYMLATGEASFEVMFPDKNITLDKKPVAFANVQTHIAGLAGDEAAPSPFVNIGDT
ncbi:MAG: DUF4403 family protein, partial [Gammaproteobacteria bacterium]|nr:DUF4403 family protein [Gammaproteobacteria bacterium]